MFSTICVFINVILISSFYFIHIFHNRIIIISFFLSNNIFTRVCQYYGVAIK